MEKQVLQGQVTYLGLASAALAHVLDLVGLVPPRYDSVTAAGVLVGLAAAAYGRFRREERA